MLYRKKKPENWRKLGEYNAQKIYDEVSGYEEVSPNVVREALRRQFGKNDGDRRLYNITNGIVERNGKDYIYFSDKMLRGLEELMRQEAKATPLEAE
jgi:hypothetical protein